MSMPQIHQPWGSRRDEVAPLLVCLPCPDPAAAAELLREQDQPVVPVQ